MIDPRVASGLRDLPPSVMIPRERMLQAFRATFGSFGFVPIETPHIERVEVLTGKGAGSDEVLRQIFEVTNKGGTPGELALRFDLTVPLARFVAKHVEELGTPFKAKFVVGDGWIHAYYNDELKASIERKSKTAYFKAGAYVQANCDKVYDCTEDNIGQVVVSGLRVSHSGAPLGDGRRDRDDEES